MSEESDGDDIPEEKPENDIGDQTAMEMDLIAQISTLETEEK